MTTTARRKEAEEWGLGRNTEKDGGGAGDRRRALGEDEDRDGPDGSVAAAATADAAPTAACSFLLLVLC